MGSWRAATPMHAPPACCSSRVEAAAGAALFFSPTVCEKSVGDEDSGFPKLWDEHQPLSMPRVDLRSGMTQ